MSLARLVGRYVIATALIPVGVALGVGGLLQFALRRKARAARRAQDERSPDAR